MYQFLICSTDLYVQNGRKVICGTQSGALLLYSWGHFKDCRYSMSNIFRWSVVDSHFLVCIVFVGSGISSDFFSLAINVFCCYGPEYVCWISSDRFIDLSPNSVDALLKVGVFCYIDNTSWLPCYWMCSNQKLQCLLYQLDEDRIITGSENGLIRWEVLESGRILLLSAHKFLFLACLFWLLIFPQFMFSLVGILPNRIIQPIAEHSEYPVERLGMLCLKLWSMLVTVTIFSYLRCLDDSMIFSKM